MDEKRNKGGWTFVRPIEQPPIWFSQMDDASTWSTPSDVQVFRRDDPAYQRFRAKLLEPL